MATLAVPLWMVILTVPLLMAILAVPLLMPILAVPLLMPILAIPVPPGRNRGKEDDEIDPALSEKRRSGSMLTALLVVAVPALLLPVVAVPALLLMLVVTGRRSRRRSRWRATLLLPR
jgi:hypothetical protein